MKQLKNLLVLLLLTGFYVPSYAAVSDVDITSCSVFSEGDTKEGEEAEEEEPDCE